MTRIRSSSAWSLAEIERFLAGCVIPVRLACLTSRREPIVCSLWYLHEDGALWCATQNSAKVAQYLRHHPFCGFEISTESLPYKGVRGQGEVTLSLERGPDILLRLIDRYLGTRDSGFARWLIARSSDEVAIAIRPRWLTAWDFSTRMRSE
jgi:hypothetical protein